MNWDEFKIRNESLLEEPSQFLILLQMYITEWAAYNFPDTTIDTPYLPLLGAVEEIGELAHAHLKNVQNIRWMDQPEVAVELKKDAIGDVIIYLAHYCALSGLSLAECVQEAWKEVHDRDWIRYPDTGGKPSSPND